MIPVPVETPKPAIELLAAGQADVFSHVVPMLATAQPSLPGSRILPGSYYNVPFAIGYPKAGPPRWPSLQELRREREGVGLRVAGDRSHGRQRHGARRLPASVADGARRASACAFAHSAVLLPTVEMPANFSRMIARHIGV